MSNLTIKLYEETGRWKAVIPQLLIVGEGDDPGKATEDAVRQADALGPRLVATGLAKKRANGSYHSVGSAGGKARDILIESGIKGVVLLAVIVAVFLIVRGDLVDQAKQFRKEVTAEIALLRQTIDGTAFEEKDRVERLRQRAKNLNDRLMPVAAELRPLFRTLLGDPDDVPNVSR